MAEIDFLRLRHSHSAILVSSADRVRLTLSRHLETVFARRLSRGTGHFSPRDPSGGPGCAMSLSIKGRHKEYLEYAFTFDSDGCAGMPTKSSHGAERGA
jgi:hypothetical protein